VTKSGNESRPKKIRVRRTKIRPGRTKIRAGLIKRNKQDKLKERVKAGDVPSMKRLTVTLKSNGFRYGTVNNRRGWYVIRLEQ
jgi:hypothetical protein